MSPRLREALMNLQILQNYFEFLTFYAKIPFLKLLTKITLFSRQDVHTKKSRTNSTLLFHSSCMLWKIANSLICCTFLYTILYMAKKLFQTKCKLLLQDQKWAFLLLFFRILPSFGLVNNSEIFNAWQIESIQFCPFAEWITCKIHFICLIDPSTRKFFFKPFRFFF